MLTAHNYRLYPSREQKIQLVQHFGCARLVYNDASAYSQDVYKSTGRKISDHDLINRLPKLKTERPYLKDVDAQVLQQSIMDFCRARRNFLVLKRGFPKFKTRRSRQSVRFPQCCRVGEINHTIRVTKIGTIKAVIHRPVGGIVKSITISKNAAGQYHAAVLVEDGLVQPDECVDGKAIGIDLGLTDFLVTSDKDHIANPKHFKQHRKNLKRKQQVLARCQKGSNRRKKAVLRVAKIHLRIANKRKDFIHKVSRKLVDENQVIVFEDLNIKGMMKNHHLANGIGTAGWGMIVNFSKYKAQREGKMVLKCGRYTPTSKPCSHCGVINTDLKLKDRAWTCRRCGSHHQRDENAAINIVRGGCLEQYETAWLLKMGRLKRA